MCKQVNNNTNKHKQIHSHNEPTKRNDSDRDDERGKIHSTIRRNVLLPMHYIKLLHTEKINDILFFGSAHGRLNGKIFLISAHGLLGRMGVVTEIPGKSIIVL